MTKKGWIPRNRISVRPPPEIETRDPAKQNFFGPRLDFGPLPPPLKIGPHDPTKIRMYFVDPTKKIFRSDPPPPEIETIEPPQKFIETKNAATIIEAKTARRATK